MLALVMVLGLAAPAAATGHDNTAQISSTKSDAPSSLTGLGQTSGTAEAEPEHEDSDVVRVSILLEEASTLQAGFSSMDVAEDARAMEYRDGLKARQQDITERLERALGSELDVVWNLTLAANLICANVAYGDIAKIEAVSGVAQVILENVYEPATYVCGHCGAVRENPFGDTDPDAFYIDGVLWAVENGITTGTSETTFTPEGLCSRAGAVTFLWRTFA